MTISVCMGTYNGEKYIERQLDSILRQTRVPDQVILCDDGSRDGTVNVIRTFIAQNGLEGSWSLFEAEKHLGYPGIFYRAMSLCTEDIVFFSDQDDIWQEKKLQRMTEIFENEPDAKAVCCKFGLIGPKDETIHTLMAPSHSHESGTLRKVTVRNVFYKCEWPGMVLAYRNLWYRRRLQTSGVIPHDFLICARAAEEESFFQLDQELALHRRHENNAGGEEHRLGRLLNKQRKLKEIEDYLRILDAFSAEEVLQTEEGRRALEEKRSSMRGRYLALKSGKKWEVLQNARRNKGQVRMKTLICDLLIAGK